MPDFDLDNLKKTWQEQKVQPKYDNTEIIQMLNKKSRNYVKYIFWISLVEFLFFVSTSFFYISSNSEQESLLNLFEKIGIEKTIALEKTFQSLYLGLKIISLLVLSYFVIKFYINYRKINVEENLKQLIIQIKTFKKTVNAFIVINVLLLVTFSSILTIILFITLSKQEVTLDMSTKTGLVAGIICTTIITVLLIWGYYRLAYGIIMKRLNKNLQQLKEIDEIENS